MSTSAGRAAFQISFQLSPIILTGGIASLIPGGALPIISITQALDFVGGLLGGADLNLDDFFANFSPMAGSSLIDQSIGEYPFANQTVAANAVIANPLVVSMHMVCPAKGRFGYATKLATMMALQATLKKHNASGGTYVVATPSFFYTNCVMLGMRDISRGGGYQQQTEWQLDFRKPLLTLDDAMEAQNNLMSQISAGVPIQGEPTWSGLPPTVGQPPSLAAPSLVPAASGPAGAGTPPPIPAAGGSF